MEFAVLFRVCNLACERLVVRLPKRAFQRVLQVRTYIMNDDDIVYSTACADRCERTNVSEADV